MEKYIDKNGIPIQVPEFEPSVTFNTTDCVVTDYNWGKFYEMDREKQIDTLGFILQSLKELPETLQMHKRSEESPRLTRRVGLKSGNE